MELLIKYLYEYGTTQLKTTKDKTILDLHRRLENNPYEQSPELLQKLIAARYPFRSNDLTFIRQALEFKHHTEHAIPLHLQLDVWARHQRAIRKKGTLKPRREQFLNRLKMVWSILDERWEQNLAALARIRAMPCGYYITKNKSLSIWINNLRRSRAQLSKEKIDQLNSLGFIWEPRKTNWQNGIAEIKAFRERFGHGNIPRGNKDYPRGAELITDTRVAYNGYLGLSKSRVRQFEALNVSWKVHEDQWATNFEKLKAIVKTTGVIPTRKKPPEDAAVALWLKNQHSSWCKLAPERRLKLLGLGITKKKGTIPVHWRKPLRKKRLKKQAIESKQD